MTLTECFVGTIPKPKTKPKARVACDNCGRLGKGVTIITLAYCYYLPV